MGEAWYPFRNEEGDPDFCRAHQDRWHQSGFTEEDWEEVDLWEDEGKMDEKARIENEG